MAYRIQQAAELAAHHYRSFLDEKQSYLPYFYAFFDEEGASAAHCEWDFGDATGRYVDALITCRGILEDDMPSAEEEKLKQALHGMFRDDGLSYRIGAAFGNDMANSFDQRSVMIGLNTWYRATGDPAVLSRIRRLIEGIRSVGIDRGSYFYLPFADHEYGRQYAQADFAAVPGVADPCHYGGGVLILPLMQFYRMTGDVEALSLAEKLSRFIIEHSTVFAEDGSFWIKGLSDCDGHFHSRLGTVAGILYCALALGRLDWIEFCRTCYAFGKKMGTSYGLFPEGLGSRPETGAPCEYPAVARHSEICGTTDMLHIALVLSREGIADAWDVAERFSNHLFASQLKDVSWVKEAHGREDTDLRSYRDVPARYLGAFTGRTMANDLLNNGRYDTMGCCAAAGGHALGLLLDHVAARQGGKLLINLWLSCDTPIASVQTDGVTITVIPKQDGPLLVRKPGWMAYMNGTEQTIKNTTYLAMGSCNAGEPVTLRAEAPLRVVNETFCGEILSVTWQGNAVRDVQPRGVRPLYGG